MSGIRHLLYTKKACFRRLLKATRIGIEPTTSAVTGRRSNQLSHRARYKQNIKYRTKVDLQGLEPGTDRL